MALHEPGWVPGSQTGSALRLLSRSLLEPLLGVMVSMTCPSVKASPCQWKCASRSSGARVVREPTMKPTPASFRAFRLAVDSVPAPGDYDQGLDLGGLAELFNDTDDRGGLGPVALPATDSQGEAGTVDQ